MCVQSDIFHSTHIYTEQVREKRESSRITCDIDKRILERAASDRYQASVVVVFLFSLYIDE